MNSKLAATVSNTVTSIILAYLALRQAQEQLQLAEDARDRSRSLLETNRVMISADLSAIYVMTLPGNLISITEGTLTLLGIASASALLARVPVAGAQGAVTPQPGSAAALPEWSDLIIPDRTTQEIDVTRLQMLAFTLMVAAFVVVKVVDYEIPQIPANSLLLMGISNGVYVTGKRLPSQPKGGGVSPTS